MQKHANISKGPAAERSVAYWQAVSPGTKKVFCENLLLLAVVNMAWQVQSRLNHGMKYILLSEITIHFDCDSVLNPKEIFHGDSSSN